MKKVTIKAIKGESIVYCSIYANDERGQITNDPKKVARYSVSLGGACGNHTHETRQSAEMELKLRIGELVLNGYAVFRA